MLRCNVQASHPLQDVRVAFDPTPDPDLFNDPKENREHGTSVRVAGGAFLFPHDARWQRFVGHLVVNAILALQPEYFFFHAAAIAIGERGVLLTGRSGSGKTSISLALAARGHGFLSDEIGALRLATGELVPVRRAALVRPTPSSQSSEVAAAVASGAAGTLSLDGDVRVCVPVARVFPVAAARIAPLTHVIHLRRFASRTHLERVRLTTERLDTLTPIACTLNGAGAASRVTRLFALLGGVTSYALDAASPAEGALAIERVVD